MGTTLAEAGNLEDAEIMFLKAMQCEDVQTKAMMNMALLLQKKANDHAAGGDLNRAKEAVDEAAKMIDEAKPLLDAKMALGGATSEDSYYASQLKPLRVQLHRLTGQIYAGMQDFASCEQEFRTASEKFPDIPGIWDALARVMDIQGKTVEANEARAKLAALRSTM